MLKKEIKKLTSKNNAPFPSSILKINAIKNQSIK